MQMKNGWTGGQYGVYRAVLGLYLLQHFVGLLPWGGELFSSSGVLPVGSSSPLMHLFPNIFWLWDSRLFVSSLLITGAALSGLLLIGKFDRFAAVLIWYLWACLYGRNPMIGNPSLPFVGWLVLAHTLATSRSVYDFSTTHEESTGAWQLSPDTYAAAWILMTFAYSYSGYTKLLSPSWIDGSALSRVLANPLARATALRTFLLGLPPWFLTIATWSALGLELSFAPLALFRRLRPLIWVAMVGLHVGLMFLVNFADLTMGMLILHLFTFDPSWIPSLQPANQPIFFDGQCALCHGFVRFVLKEDRSVRPFSFSPLQGDFVRRAIAEDVRGKLPDSLVVLDEKNNVLVRSAAVIYVMKRLGGIWFLAASLMSFLPRALLDFGYVAVASLRKTILGAPKEMCPLVPPEYRARLRG
jgi:predicted DCC family thiol-disulfide oxidoreductase YuxK